MTYKVIIKRQSDKYPSKMYISEEYVYSFLKDIKEKNFWTLWGKIVFWKVKDIDLLQIFEINYDSTEGGTSWFLFNVWAFNWRYWDHAEFCDAFDFDSSFLPEERDVTTELISKYCLSRNIDKKEKVKIKSISYCDDTQKLIFDGVEFDLSGNTKYKEIIRLFFEAWQNNVDLADIANEYTWLDNAPENERKWIRNSVEYFNRKIEEEFEIKELIWIGEKALRNSFPVVLKDSE